jgi:hypothetical protein
MVGTALSSSMELAMANAPNLRVIKTSSSEKLVVSA